MLTKEVYRYIAVATALTALALVARAYGGYLLQNPAVALEALHALLDVVITLMVLASMALVRSSIARKFPYGLYKVEDLITLGLAAIMGITAAETALSTLTSPPPPPAVGPAIAQGLTLPLLAGAALAKFRGSEASNSPALRADALHTVSDVVEGGGVLAGLGAYVATSSSIAYTVSLIIAVAGLAWASVEAGKDALLSLLDLPKDRSLVDGVKDVVKSVSKGEFKLVDVRARWAGPVVFLELTIQAPPLYVVEDAYVFVRRLTEAVKSRYGFIEDVAVKVEPTSREDFTLCIPQEEVGLDKPPSEHFGRAKYFAIVRIKGMKVVKVEYVKRPEPPEALAGDERRKFLIGATVAEELFRMGVTDVAVTNVGEIAYSLLLRHKIVVWKIDPNIKTAEEVVRKFLRRELERLTEPTREEPWARPHRE